MYYIYDFYRKEVRPGTFDTYRDAEIEVKRLIDKRGEFGLSYDFVILKKVGKRWIL